MALRISDGVRNKLASKHGVSEDEIVQCFANRSGQFLEDTREAHRSDPPTEWFIAETDFGRELKVVFVNPGKGDIFIKSAFEPNQRERRIYQKYGQS